MLLTLLRCAVRIARCFQDLIRLQGIERRIANGVLMRLALYLCITALTFIHLLSIDLLSGAILESGVCSHAERIIGCANDPSRSHVLLVLLLHR